MTDPLANRVRIKKTGLFEMIPDVSPPPFDEERRARNFTSDCVHARNHVLQQIMRVHPSYRTYRKIRFEDWRVVDITPQFLEGRTFHYDPTTTTENEYKLWARDFMVELASVGFTEKDAYLSPSIQRYFNFVGTLFAALILHNDPNTVMYARLRGWRLCRVNELIGDPLFEMAAL